jgi:phosphoglycolate phosphatase
VLDVLNLHGFFDVVVAGDTLARRKPDPAPLRHAFEALGRPGVYVGDNGIDAQTAQGAGVPFWLFTEGIRHDPLDRIPHDHAFSDYAAISTLYAELRG